MIGLVLVTHGRLAVEFRAALEHVVGPQSQIEVVTIGPDDDVEQRRKDIIEAVKRVDTGDGVAILTDMFGGTPSNLAISCMGRPNVEVLAGINMPMLVKLHAEIHKALENPKLREFYLGNGYQPVGEPPAQFQKTVRADLKRWGEVARLAKIEPQ